MILLERASEGRITAATAMNLQSSRLDNFFKRMFAKKKGWVRLNP